MTDRMHGAAFIQKMASSRMNLSATWVLHHHSHWVGLTRLLVNILDEGRGLTLVLPCLSGAGTVDKQIVSDLLGFVLYFQLVDLMVSRPVDITVPVQCKDVVYGRVVVLQAPAQSCWHTWPFDPAPQLHIFSNSDSGVATDQFHFQRRLCIE